MDIRTISNPVRRFVFLGVLLAVSACGDGGNAPDPDCRLNEDGTFTGGCRIEIQPLDLLSAGGIWRGIDFNGQSVLVLATVLGKFQFVDGAGNQGAGFLNVGESNEVDSSFPLVAQFNTTFADGTSRAECTLSGTITERQLFSVTESCTTSTGHQFEESFDLTFDSLYEREASLEIISGIYETPTGSILEIGPDGVVFSQDAKSGCVRNGQVNGTLSNANMYLLEYDLNGCVGQYANWNGSSFNGLGFIDDTISPQTVRFAVTGVVDGIGISVVSSGERL